jgi:xylulose-5-phosphate/fructose-6-phosphate phosphoketolase
MEMLSEHQCEGWLEGYLLTGRHGLFNCYEAFIHIVDSMFNQHAKWLKVTINCLRWRRKIASLNYLLSSHVWRQDHNGFTHQDPWLHRSRPQQEGPDRAGLPAARRQLPAFRRWIIVCAAGTTSTWLLRANMRRRNGWISNRRCRHPLHRRGSASGTWASSDEGEAEPDVVMACAGDVPTLGDA